MIIKSLDPLKAKKTFIRKKLGHTMVSVIKASSVTLLIWQKEPEENTMNLQLLIMAVVSKTDISRKRPNYFKFVKKMNLNVRSFSNSQNIFHDLKGPKVKRKLNDNSKQVTCRPL